jgi:hypothetical protein
MFFNGVIKELAFVKKLFPPLPVIMGTCVRSKNKKSFWGRNKERHQELFLP